MASPEKIPEIRAESVSAGVPEDGTAHSLIDVVTERKLVRKLDLYITPVIFFTYLCSFLDRINIGNAKVAGLPEDLHLHGNEINGLSFVIFDPVS